MEELRFEQIIQDGMNKYLSMKGLDISTANAIQRGNVLTEFYIKEIGQYLYNIYEDDIADGLLCDGKNDLNIDFVYKNEKNIFILQSKFKGQKNGLKTDEISGFFNIHERILDEAHFSKHANNAVKEAVGKRNHDSVFSYIFLSNDKASAFVTDEFNRLKKIYENKYSNVNYEFKPFSEIKRDFRQVMSESEIIEVI